MSFLNSKVTTWIALLAAIFGALNSAEVLSVVPPAIGGVIAGVAAVLGAISRSLLDANHNGIPDIFESRGG